MKKRREYYEGYLSVEATFIIPIAVMLIMLLIYWGFYCYEKSISIQCSYLAVLRGSNEWEMSGKELEIFVEENLKTMIDERLLYLKGIDITVEAGLAHIKAQVKGKIENLFSKIGENSLTQWNAESLKRAYRLKPSSFIRKYRIFGE